MALKNYGRCGCLREDFVLRECPALDLTLRKAGLAAQGTRTLALCGVCTVPPPVPTTLQSSHVGFPAASLAGRPLLPATVSHLGKAACPPPCQGQTLQRPSPLGLLDLWSRRLVGPSAKRAGMQLTQKEAGVCGPSAPASAQVTP